MDITQGVPFDTFGLSESTMRAIRNKGYTISTPVQAGCIPPMLAGKDVIAKAPTGTGKTMAFGLPIIERMDRESEAVQALILAPTRELAMQITQELREVAVYHEGLRVVCLYGGEPIGKQINALKRKPQIVVATPGRLSDHMKRRTVTVKEVQTVVLDEADRMLDMGFEPQIRKIVSQIRPDRQTLMWSATWPKEVQALARDFLHDPIQVNVGSMDLHVTDHVKQVIKCVSESQKLEETMNILRNKDPASRVIIFTQSKRGADELTRRLRQRGFNALAIHGDKQQAERDFVLNEFKSGRVTKFREGSRNILIATDVASRGLDIPNVDFVLNFDIPSNGKDYIHRVGRAGRKTADGYAEGVAVSFFTDTSAKVTRVRERRESHV